MERKSTIERNGKKYFMDIIFKHEDYLNYPYVGGYYITGVPLAETLDVNGEIVTYKQYAYEKIELLIEYDKPDEQGLSVAQKVADKHIDGIIAQIEQDKREEQIKEENKRIDIEETLDRANTDLENILKGNKKDNDIHDIFDLGFLNGDMFNFNSMIEEIKAEEKEKKNHKKSSDRDLSGIEKCKYYTQPSNVTFDDIAGMEETKEEVLEAIDIFKNTEKYEAMGIHKTLNNIMLSGASGCGKTLIVKAISNELDLPLFSTSGDVSDKYVGQTSRNIETLFNDARKYAPSIIFIDEFEAMAKQRTGESNNQEREGGVSTLLAQLDGLGSSEEVMVIVATNLPDVIDEAVQRRFPTKIAISNPDYQTRLGILQINSKNMKMEEDVDLEKIARNLSGFNGGMIAQIMQNAGILAVRRDKEKVGQEELEDSMERVIAGLKSKTKRLNENEKVIVSYHEVGHAVLTYLLKAEVIQKISITPTTGSTLGYVLYANEENDDKFLSTKEELLNDIVVSLGGRCAEEIVFNMVTGGCSNDLEKATRIAENMVTKLGMCSDTFGLMSINPNDVFMRERVLTEVNSILMSSYSRAKQVLTNNRHLLDELAKVLIEKEVMTLQDFKEVVDRVGVVVEEEVL